MAAESNSLKEEIRSHVVIGGTEYHTREVPRGLLLQEKLGLITGAGVTGQVVHRNAYGGLFETRATITPGGEYLLMFPDGLPHTRAEGPNAHYGGQTQKVNDLVAYRSKDKGRTWSGPTVPFDIDYNQHGFIPLIPRGSKRLYAFGTQPVWDMWEPGVDVNPHNGLRENAPIGYRYSDDDGLHWSEVRIIRPRNDPGYRGMSVMRMTETDRGTWLLGTHEGDWSYSPLLTRLYVLRSEDQGKTWDLLPRHRHGGWYAPGFNRMDEGRPIALGDGKVYMMMRTPAGQLWDSRSEDDGKTWSDPKPTTLIHPDAPPMLFHLTDGKTLVAFHHNRHHDVNYKGLNGNLAQMADRSELWVSFSPDEGRTWSEPRFLLVNALADAGPQPFFNYQCSYLDMFADNGTVNLFLPHRWRRAVHMQISEADLRRLPTKAELK